MSSSHLFLGLPIALLVLYLELRSRFHSAAFFNHLSLGDGCHDYRSQMNSVKLDDSNAQRAEQV